MCCAAVALLFTSCGRARDVPTSLDADAPAVAHVEEVELRGEAMVLATDAGRAIRVFNRDSFAWLDVSLVVNGAFWYEMDQLSAGASADVPLSEFLDDAGKRFVEELRELEIHAAGPGNDGATVVGFATFAWEASR